MHSQRFQFLHSTLFRGVLPALLLGTLMAATAWAQSDDFNDGNDDGWTQYDPISQAAPGVGSWTFPNMNSYRISSTPSPLPGVVGPGRVGSLRTDVTYTDFFLSVDILEWDPAADQAIGFIARVTNVGLGSTDGYAMTYDTGGGDFDLVSFTNEVPAQQVTLVGEDSVNMQPGQSYRYVFQGKGINFTIKVYRLPDTDTPIAEASGADATFTGGFCGLLAFDLSAQGNGITGVTFDNYFAAEVEPPTLSVDLSDFGDLTLFWPTTAVGFILQATPSLDTPAWEDIPPPYQAIGQFFAHPEDRLAQPARTYRLIRP